MLFVSDDFDFWIDEEALSISYILLSKYILETNDIHNIYFNLYYDTLDFPPFIKYKYIMENELSINKSP